MKKIRPFKTKLVDWDKLKRELGEEFYKSPLCLIENKDWRNECKETEELKAGHVFISPDEKIDGIYVIIKGRIGIGDYIDNEYFVERLFLEPISFVGELEAPWKIEDKDYIQTNPRHMAWVSSRILSKIMAYSDKSRKVAVADENTQTYRILSKFLNGIRLEEENNLPPEIKLFSKDERAKLIKIPLTRLQDLWNEPKIKEFMCENAFVKNKRYMLVPYRYKKAKKAKDAASQIIALYEYAKLNKILINDSLFILGNKRLNALLESPLRFERREERNRVVNELKKEKFEFSELKKKAGKLEKENLIGDEDLWNVYCLMCIPKATPSFYKIWCHV